MVVPRLIRIRVVGVIPITRVTHLLWRIMGILSRVVGVVAQTLGRIARVRRGVMLGRGISVGRSSF